ncbi:hypothetical protein [Pseudoramibacter sp.]|jgi:pyocin large subunit-like protein|uniref:hypothetical protein n=1 Tax=Pseudoramibacter sp. TaxID=2034862 RepID=UPI0025F4CED2|nr:hypothetical protein [Pseudoramibacter sp.]MCH4072362.1 hypothetical protein [Pseudoramibacter sp.]MCH4106133.1 hypothetical protein [Pseudoramibacter sp.]
MTTKAASNRYGNNRNGRTGKKTSKINFPWAKDFNTRTADDHFQRHGSQMGTNTKESYIAHAVKFANHVDRKNNVSFVDKKGTTYKYNKPSNTLVIVTKDGIVITYFKPENGYRYYLNERNQKKK